MNNLINFFNSLSFDDKWLLIGTIIFATVLGIAGIVISFRAFLSNLKVKIQEFNNEDIDEE